ncbi:2-hydroxyacid dehydrogenase [Neobacillus muris]|uniref:2-hydroxyacid dehydrogenase n=1 Tax=Neobacillus muris TaxID=2941334 RepID=UPI002041C352|nr:D-glycerate dehydrogenase [Neobacillus muris]
MKPKIVVAYNKVSPKVLSFLSESYHVINFDKLDAQTLPNFYQELGDAHGLLTAGLKIDSALLNRAPQLKIVSNISVGYDNLNLLELNKRNVMATNTPGVLNDTVADTVMGLILAVARRIPELDQHVKTGNWKVEDGVNLYGNNVHHKVLGIIGMGGIGTAVAKRAHFGFDMPILYHNRSRHTEAEQMVNAVYCSLEELCQQSDFMCLLTPLTPQTVKLIGEKEFKQMKSTAIFINASRGATVDEQALIRALENKEILGAGLDVFEQEPVSPGNKLLSMDNVVALPHIGSATHETRLEMAMLAAENLVSGLQGKMPPNLINREALKNLF